MDNQSLVYSRYNCIYCIYYRVWRKGLYGALRKGEDEANNKV